MSVCAQCGKPVDQHPAGTAGCWDGRARMASARRAAATERSWTDSRGRVLPLVPALDAVDLEALHRAEGVG